MRQWFNNLRRQEQIMLLIGTSAVIAYFILVVVLVPMAKTVTELESRNDAAIATLSQVKQLAAEFGKLEKSSTTSGHSGESITRIIDSTVRKNNLTMSRFQPSSSGDVQVRFENAAFNNILAWLQELESEHGVAVKDLTVSPGSASGLVNVSVRLHQGA